MRYLKSYKIFESVLGKKELVEKIKYLSNYVHNYMKDVNKFTTSNLNFAFGYDTELEIIQIFEASNELSEESPDGFITAVANEFITWGKYINRINIRNKRNEFQLKAFEFDEDYEDYTDEYKKNNSIKLYDQKVRNSLYVYISETIEKMISGTIWDIPSKDFLFTDEDLEFIIHCFKTDYDIPDDWNGVPRVENRDTKWEKKRGTIVTIPSIQGDTLSRKIIKNDSDFMYRLQSYFDGALIISRYDCYKIYIPFYKP
jgi:hypothetical protein